MSDDSYEKNMKAKMSEKSFLEDRLSIPMLKYFWQASPLTSGKKSTIPVFLRKINIFKFLSNDELRICSKFMHKRVFSPGEVIFKEGDNGFAFYLVYAGEIEFYTEKRVHPEDDSLNFVTTISKYDYFGELSILEEQNLRNATAISKGHSTLLAFFKPDLEELRERYPYVTAKFIQGLSIIVAKRFTHMVMELRSLKARVAELEGVKAILEQEGRDAQDQ